MNDVTGAGARCHLEKPESVQLQVIQKPQRCTGIKEIDQSWKTPLNPILANFGP